MQATIAMRRNWGDNRRLALLSALAAALLAGCKEEQVVAPAPGETQLTLSVGESQVLGPSSTRLGFERVTGDSRCPTGVVCVWAGDASVRLWLLDQAAGRHDRSSADTVFVELRFPGPSAQAEALGFQIRAIGLDPHPRESVPISPSSYRLKLKVTKLQN